MSATGHSLLSDHDVLNTAVVTASQPKATAVSGGDSRPGPSQGNQAGVGALINGAPFTVTNNEAGAAQNVQRLALKDALHIHY